MCSKIFKNIQVIFFKEYTSQLFSPFCHSVILTWNKNLRHGCQDSRGAGHQRHELAFDGVVKRALEGIFPAYQAHGWSVPDHRHLIQIVNQNLAEDVWIAEAIHELMVGGGAVRWL